MLRTSRNSFPRPQVKYKKSRQHPHVFDSNEETSNMPPSSTLFRRRTASPLKAISKRRSTFDHSNVNDLEIGYVCPHVPYCFGYPYDPSNSSSLVPTPRHDLYETAVINVGGKRYETLISTLNRFPGTLLGDPVKRDRYFNPNTKEYFFDRNRACFDPIFELYQTGEPLYRPHNVPIQKFVRELFFYEVGEEVINEFLEGEGLLREHVLLPKNPLQRYIWKIFETTDSCWAARIIAVVNVLMVLMAVVTFCIQTLPEYQTRDVFVNGTLAINVDSWGENNVSNPFFIVETLCTIWFTLDLVIRFSVSPLKNRFFLNGMNIIDILSIMPYFIDLALNSPQEHIAGEPSKVMLLTILRILRVIKIFRVFKLGRYSNGLQTLAMTLRAARYEVGLMLVVVSIGVIVFSAAVYYAELGSGQETKFTSIPAGFWWAIITWTTVGYGDVVPVSIGGKIVGGFCALCGILGLSFMVPVIVAHFEHFFYRAQDLEKLDEVFQEVKERKKCLTAFTKMRQRQMKTGEYATKMSNGSLLVVPLRIDEAVIVDETTKESEA
ncbi:potassium voltage-gated channel subfamily A member 2-like isoform X2 [Paramacrobiotus metropolitanus]|uniref:potassium voltage-gated channel subfamily A member 2-like isoform X2 n=1 Tax=Paramacrobiotus metropolitanus TaxID=2943436 RepID=UPI0024456593|nr:potassium voltage-gated channel subfamily A member 2-like isoform X2 [Paramacrobiotus metropolitanus]